MLSKQELIIAESDVMEQIQSVKEHIGILATTVPASEVIADANKDYMRTLIYKLHNLEYQLEEINIYTLALELAELPQFADITEEEYLYSIAEGIYNSNNN